MNGLNLINTHSIYDLEDTCDILEVDSKKAEKMFKFGTLQGFLLNGIWYIKGDRLIEYLRKKEREKVTVHIFSLVGVIVISMHWIECLR